MRLFRLLFFAVLFAAGEVSVPMVEAVPEAAEEAAEETPHPSARRRSERRPAAARTAPVEAAALQTAHRPLRPAVTRGVELNHGAAIRKMPPPSSASSSAPEDH